MSAQTSLTQAEIERLAAVVCGSDDITSAEERADLVARLLLAMRPADQTLVLRIDLAEQLSTTANLVVRQLIDSLTNQRVLLILVSLDGRLPPAGAVTLPIAGLLEDEFLALGRQLFADGRVDRDLLRDAHATLAGSPGNLLEALAVLERQGRLAGPIGKYHMLMPVRHLRPAHTLLERLRERLAGLTEPQRFVHTAAAVLGNSFPLADLSQLVGQSELLVLETLSIFQGRIIVTHRGNGRFRHRDFRKVMLEMVSPTVLSRLHRTAAWTLEDRGAAPLEIGLHLSRAGEHDAALQPLLSGLAKLTATGSRQQSQKIRNRLRSHFAELPDTPLYQHLRLHYLALSGQTEELADREERARVDFSAAQELAEQLGAEQALAEAHLALGRLDLGQGQMHTALTHLEAAEQQIPDDQAEPHLLAEIYGTRARVHGYLGQSNAARHYIQAALDLFVDTSDDLLAHLHTDLARIEALRNDFSAALDSLARAEAMFSGRGSSSGLLRIELHRGHILAMLGSRDQATQRLEAAAVRASELSNLRAQAKARLFLGEQALLHRDHTAARPHLEFARSNSPRDTNTRVAAEIYLAECGWQFADLPGEVATLGVPELTVAWILMTTAANPDPELLQRARQIEREVSIPLHLHRQLLYRTGRAASARRLEKRIAESLPRGPLRRRFQVLVKQAPATPDH